MSHIPGKGQWSTGPVDELAERLAWENAKKHRASGSRPEPASAASMFGPDKGLYWNIHLRRAALRVMLQAALAQGKELRRPESWEAMENTYYHVLRAFADQIAADICAKQEPEEYAKLKAIPRTIKRRSSVAGAVKMVDAPRPEYAKERAVFLSRYFPVPPPDEWSTATWTIPQMRMLGRKLCTAVDMDNNTRPHWPDGWRESVGILKGSE